MKDADDDLDLALVADDLAGALDPERSQALHERLAADPAAAGRYAEFARMLDGVSALLANEQTPPVPDDVVRRLDAALHREVDAAAAHETALRRLQPARRRSFAARSLGGGAAGLVGVAALAGVVAVIVHGGGASSSTSSGSSASVASAAAPAAAPAAGSGSSGTARAAVSAAPVPAQSPELESSPEIVTAGNLPSVVRAVFPFTQFSSSVATGGVSAPTPLSHLGGAVSVSAGCRPAGVPLSVRLLAARTVRFAGRPAVLLVLAGPTDRSGAVRATVVAACGGPALLSQQVSATG
jgi:hypothetical protein